MVTTKTSAKLYFSRINKSIFFKSVIKFEDITGQLNRRYLFEYDMSERRIASTVTM